MDVKGDLLPLDLLDEFGNGEAGDLTNQGIVTAWRSGDTAAGIHRQSARAGEVVGPVWVLLEREDCRRSVLEARRPGMVSGYQFGSSIWPRVHPTSVMSKAESARTSPEIVC
ncbi:hypothetical protein [Nakamurella lactea]|uniref:hypothetical protein n=1 Tax=Nakamurella lactea TaxID=459515 RepID=UPI0012B62B38|nr:hypothetical protein [Nakamurella lactea]